MAQLKNYRIFLREKGALHHVGVAQGLDARDAQRRFRQTEDLVWHTPLLALQCGAKENSAVTDGIIRGLLLAAAEG